MRTHPALDLWDVFWATGPLGEEASAPWLELGEQVRTSPLVMRPGGQDPLHPFFFVLARLTLQLEIVQSFALRITLVFVHPAPYVP